MNTLFVAVSCALIASAISGIVPTSYVAGPVGIVTGHGAFNSLESYGGYPKYYDGVYNNLGYGKGYYGDYLWNGHHGGVVVQGPKTVPAIISGPSGKIIADGLYGVPAHDSYGLSGYGLHGW